MNAAILGTRTVQAVVAQHDVKVLDADVSKDETAAKLLNELGYDSVPVLAVFRGSEPVAVLPDLITPSMVLDAIETAAK